MKKGVPKFHGSYNHSLLGKSSEEEVWSEAEVRRSRSPGCNRPCALVQKEDSAKAGNFHWDSVDDYSLNETGSIG
jgi:hypothetical protein